MNHECRPFFSIILPTYNRLNSLIDIFFPSLEKQCFVKYELILVDDNSTDGTCEYLNSADFEDKFPNCHKRLRYFKNSRNKGSPASRNVGFNNAIANWIFMVEDDLEIREPDFLGSACKIILKLINEYSMIGVVCPKREEYWSKGYYNNFNGSFINYGWLSKEIYCDPNQEYEGFVENAHACSFIDSTLAKQLLYDEISYKYFREESDFYERVKRCGFKIFYVGNKIKTYHRMDLVKEGGNRKHSSNFINEYKYILSHYIFVKKYYNVPVIRTGAFIFVRFFKHAGNVLKLKFINNFISLIRL